MLTSLKMVIRLTAEVELTEGNVLFGFEKVKLQIGYWKVVARSKDKIKMKELHTGQLKLISYGMLGNLVSAPTNAINFISEDDVPSVVNL